MYSIAKSVPSAYNPSDEPAYSCPFASYNFPNNPIPAPRPITPPTAPTNLVVSNVTPTGFTISWTAGTDAVDNVVSWGSYTIVSFGTNATFTGLPPSTTNNCVVTAINAGGSAVSSPLSVTTGSSQPTGLAVTNVTSTGFLCSWNYESGATYTITWGTFVGTITGNGTGSFTGLPAQTTNNFIVSAFGTSSQPLSVTTAPSTPTGFAVTRRGTNYLNFTWTTVPNVSYNITLGTYTASIVSPGVGKFQSLPVGYSGTVQISATNSTGTSSAPFGTQTLLSPILFDTGNQNQANGQIGFFLGALSPGSFTVPANFDILNNGSYNAPNNYAVVPQNFVTGNGGFDYNPVQGGGLFALRFASTAAPNPVGSGNPGDSWQNEWACYTTGNASEFNTLTNFTGNGGSWYLQPGDTITCYLLIAYGGWIYRTFNSVIDPSAMTAFWRIQFTYNPFSLT